MSVKDEYFADRAQDSRPLVSDGSVRLICGTVVIVAVAVLLGFRPELAPQVIGGTGMILVILGVGYLFYVTAPKG